MFLPASQVSIRRTKDISEYIAQELTCEIIKIDEERMNIVVSRRRLIEKMREKMKKALLSEITQGEIRDGIVKNIADFGAFVDLGGIDGLLHITDMSWGRITHPSEMLQVDQKIEVFILSIDRDRERIALSLKHKTASPWENIEERFPENEKVKGTVVNVMNYGAFVKLDEGIEGLVHVSEMSWSKRISNPAEVVNVGDEVEVIVLSVNADKQEISLGMKQASINPWDIVEEKYPKDAKVKGSIKHLTNYGAFVEIEEGLEGLLHVSDMSWTRKISHPKEVVTEGEPIEAIVLSIDKDKKRIALGLKQMMGDPWDEYIPSKYLVGSHFRGTISKIANFGVFIELERSLEGLLHISELGLTENSSSEDIEKVIKPGYKLDVRVIRVDETERKIGLALSVPIGEQKFEGDDSVVPTEEIAAVSPVAAEKKTEENHNNSGLGSVLAQAIEDSKTAREHGIEEKPVKAVDDKKADDKKVDDKKVEDKKVDDKKVDDKKVEDKKVEDKKVEDKKVEDKKVDDKKVDDKKVDDKKVDDKKVDDKKVDDKKVDDKKVDDKKVNDKKAEKKTESKKTKEEEKKE